MPVPPLQKIDEGDTTLGDFTIRAHNSKGADRRYSISDMVFLSTNHPPTLTCIPTKATHCGFAVVLSPFLSTNPKLRCCNGMKPRFRTISCHRFRALFPETRETESLYFVQISYNLQTEDKLRRRPFSDPLFEAWGPCTQRRP